MERAKTAETFFQRAEECLLIAKLTTTNEAKAAYARMAELYREPAAEEMKLTGTPDATLCVALVRHQRSCRRNGPHTQ